MSLTNRRHFIADTSLGIAGATSLSLSTSQAVHAANANHRVRIGVIGCGGQGSSGHIDGLRTLGNENVEIVYVCDPDERRRTDAAKRAGGAKAVNDLRVILDDHTIDAVTIATPDHWHVPAALLAMNAGKHVYVEKPCSHNLREGRLLVEGSQRTQKIVQHGTQARSNKGFIEAVQMLHDGVIGDILTAKAWNIQRRNHIGQKHPSDPPAGFDFDQWTGPAPKLPFQENRHHYNWHWWYNFGTGDLGNDGVHEFDMARWGLGMDTHPTNISVCGGKYYFDDDQEFPDTVTATFEYPGDGQVGNQRQLIFEMRIWSTNYPYNVDGGVEFLGTKGKMFFSRRGKFQLWGERNQPLAQKPSIAPEMNVANNLRSWLEAIRENNKPTAPAHEAHLSASLCHLANIACRTNQSFAFDGSTERILDNEPANALLSRSYRHGHWATPKGI